MNTSNIVRRLWRGIWLFFSISVSLVIPFDARAEAPCEIGIKPIWQEAEELRSKLETDPFASAFGQFIKDLKDNAAELEQWKADAEDFRDNTCIPYNNDLTSYENRINTFIYKGCNAAVIEDQDLYAWCVSEHDALESLKRDINDRHATQEKPGEDKLNNWGQELLNKEQRAFDRGKEMLDPGNLENAFRLYAFSVKKDVDAGSLTSCEALAQMSDALAPKTGQYGKHLAVMGSVLAPTGNPLVLAPHARSVEFTASGFQRRFVGPPGLEKDNQVRHAVAYLMAGAEFGASGANLGTYMEDRIKKWWEGRVPEEYDYLLGIAAGEIGRDLKSGSSIDGLGNTIRAKLCGY